MPVLNPGRQRGKAAFTLVELIVVVAIMGLGLSVFLGLNYRQRESFRWRTSLRELKVFLKLARSYAVLEHRPDICTYDPARRTFQENLRRRRVELAPGVELKLSEKERAAAAAPAEGEKKKAPLKLVTFYPDGGAGGGPLRLRSGSRRARLEIDPLTGEVRIVEEEADDADS